MAWDGKKPVLLLNGSSGRRGREFILRSVTERRPAEVPAL